MLTASKSGSLLAESANCMQCSADPVLQYMVPHPGTRNAKMEATFKIPMTISGPYSLQDLSNHTTCSLI